MKSYSSLRRLSRFLGLSFAASLVAFLAGCGSAEEGPDLYNISGKVTYDGEPIKTGRITFMPDATKGNKGPAGYAAIRDGVYDTAEDGGKGAVAGAIAVLITADADSGADLEGMTDDEVALTDIPEALFGDYRTTAEVDGSKGEIELDFDVPKQKRK